MKIINGLFIAVLAFMFIACSDVEPTRLTNIQGLLPNLEFKLTNEDNHTVTEKDYLGQTVVVFFGFTNCPDVCPSTLHELAEVLNKLGDLAEQVTVLFISVDPKRDSLTKLKRYTDVFGPAFIGLTAEGDLIKQMSKRYRVTFGYGAADNSGNYDVSHSGAVFIFDKHGRARLLATQKSSVEDVFWDLRLLINERAT